MFKNRPSDCYSRASVYVPDRFLNKSNSRADRTACKYRRFSLRKQTARVAADRGEAGRDEAGRDAAGRGEETAPEIDGG